MKKILITGVNSYVGNNLKNWLLKDPINYVVDTISLRNEKWKKKDFSCYDSIVHVAGIAHVSTDPNMEELYYKVNRDLTIEVAKRAKADGAKQFIFLSSIIVYGDSDIKDGVITKTTIPKPSNFYGKSKLQAEKGINELQNSSFKVLTLRPPMIYGKGSKGNYPKLAKMAKIIPIFPNIENKRSMLHIDNLSEFLKLMIDKKEQGLFFPQNKEYVKTSDLVKTIAEVHEHKILFTKIFNPILYKLSNRMDFIKKVFGNLVYEKSMSDYDKDSYQVRPFEKSIELTEK